MLHHLTVEQIILRTIVTCSLTHSLLPPWDFLDDFPRAQKVYKAFVYVVGYVALNGRSTVYRSISTSNPGGPNSSAPPPGPNLLEEKKQP